MQDGSHRGGALLAYLQLLRLPNVFTVIADVMMGYVFVHHSLAPWPSFACLLAASCSLYLAGMVLNDVFDLETDRQERPQRPLPSGRVSFRVARVLGWTLLLVGWALTIVVSFLPTAQRHSTAAPAVVGTLLTIAIVAYNAGLKQTILGPIVMGMCRFLNVLLAMSLIRPVGSALLPWGPAHLIAASAIGLHIMGITWFARDEASVSRRSTLLMGLLFVIAGWLMLAWLPSWIPARRLQLAANNMWSANFWYFAVPVLAAPLARRLILAIVDRKSETVQLAVRQGIWSLIWMDATMALLVAPPIWALIIVLLFVPMLLLARRVYST